MNDLLLTFYGDDFTGSTDVAEVLTLNGVPTVLITDPRVLPTARERFPEARAIGLAGVGRSMSPEQMDEELPPLFASLRELPAPLFHYKVCSTFDSSPDLGSIGHAIELGLQGSRPPVPMVVGAPALRRYQVFGNLFATVGDVTYRLDRHPTMSRHPATPMSEGDLRRHLALQTDRRIGLLDVLDLDRPAGEVRARFDERLAQGDELILFDVLYSHHLATVGELIWSLALQQAPSGGLFSASSSGLEYALVEHWRATGELPPLRPPSGLEPLEPIAVVSGSASPATMEQIDWAHEHGFATIRLDAPGLVDPDTCERTREDAIERALERLADGRSVVLYSVRGPDDPAIAATRRRLSDLGTNPKRVSELLGRQLGQIMRSLLERGGLRRACVAGGDTCGFALGELKVHALEVLAPAAPGAPVCRAHSEVRAVDGIEISLKGGQLGRADYFGFIRQGREPHS